MKVAGITGGIGCGKSVVAEMFRDLGAATLDSDQVARDVVADGSDGLAEILRRFGGHLKNADGGLDRKALAEIVFDYPQARLDLEDIVHPRVYLAIGEWLERQRSESIALAVLEIPLLFEVQVPLALDATICVVAAREQQIERIQARSDYDRKTIEGILAAQMSVQEKANRADYVIENGGSLENTRSQVEQVFRQITGQQD